MLLSLLAGALELTVWSEDYATKEPGNFGDPLGLNQYTEDGGLAGKGLGMEMSDTSGGIVMIFFLQWIYDIIRDIHDIYIYRHIHTY